MSRLAYPPRPRMSSPPTSFADSALFTRLLIAMLFPTMSAQTHPTMGSDPPIRPVPETPPRMKWYGLETLETATKAIAVLLVSTYIFGFLIVSLRNASHGFFEVNPLRPRILAAGLLFLFMTLLPALFANRLYSHSLELSPEQRFSRAIAATYTYYAACFVMTFMFSDSLLALPLPSTLTIHVTQLRSWLLITSMIAGFLFTFYGLGFAWRKFRTHPMQAGLFAGLGVLVLLAMNLLLVGRARPFAITMWLFGVGVVSAGLNDDLRDPQKRKELDPIWLLGLGIILLTTFTDVVYPQFKFSWGGGSPIPVVVYFSRDSRLLPGQQLDADILDESDSGFYIVQRSQTQAIFVPRGAVATIYFSDKPLDPVLLNDLPKQTPK
jgi:hypothetical protein